MTPRRPCARCEHAHHWHDLPGGRCGDLVDPFENGSAHLCDCEGYVRGVLPSGDERLEFGVHRLPEDEAETAPAWPALGDLRRQADEKYRRQVRR